MSQQQNWAAYFYPEPHQHVMRNKPGIKDPAALSLYEHRIITRRGYELTKNPELIAHTFDAEHLKAIHRYLFQDVYDWAGEYRTVDMSKGVSAFASVQDGPLSIERYLDYVFATSRATDWASLNHQEFVEVVAAIFAHLNHAHPFREGNGRATRIFMDHVAVRSNFRFDYARAGRRGWNQSSMFSGPDRGYFEVHPEELHQLFGIITVPRDS